MRAIEYLSKKGIAKFDFEGLMILGVELSYRHLGTKQTPYFQICKSNWKAKIIRENMIRLKKWLSRKG